jgi:polyhydroxyalkanoate synthesis regulator phasin
MLKNVICTALFVVIAPISTFAAPADGQPNHLTVPQSIQYEHAAIIDRVTKEAAKPGVGAAVAERILNLLKAHFAKEEQFVFPPLGLLDRIEAGEMSSDQIRKAAIDMAERTKLAREELNQEHIQITSMMDEFRQLATRANEPALMTFATELAAHSLQEIEILQPTTIMIGNYLQAKCHESGDGPEPKWQSHC